MAPWRPGGCSTRSEEVSRGGCRDRAGPRRASPGLVVYGSDFGCYPETSEKSPKVSQMCVWKITLVAGEVASEK